MGSYHNPIIHADYSDPDVICVGNDFYMVASSFTYIPGVPILHSKDLVHWHIINYAVRSLPFDKYRKPMAQVHGLLQSDIMKGHSMCSFLSWTRESWLPGAGISMASSS